MKIDQNTDTLMDYIRSGKLIDLAGLLDFWEPVNTNYNITFQNALEMELYHLGYLPFYSALAKEDERLHNWGVTGRAFYATVDDNCKLFVGINPDTDKYEIRYAVYDNNLTNKNMQHIIYALYAMGVLIPWDDVDDNSEEAS